jgi:hypothetical protein
MQRIASLGVKNGLNSYGSNTGSQHTLSGRFVPVMDAMRLAISRAAEQPVPAVKFANELPKWGHNIGDELTCTVFKGIVNMAPQGGKHHGRKSGQMVGLLIRAVLFFWKDIQSQSRRDGLDRLTPGQKKKRDKAAGWEVAMAQASQLAGRPIKTKAQLATFWTGRLRQFVSRSVKAGWRLTKYALQQPAEEVFQFLSGVPEGFKCFLRTDGEFAKTGKRTEMFFTLLIYWPEIEEMRRAQPPVTRKFLLNWLQKQEGKTLCESEFIFYSICDDIGLDMAPPGHPFNSHL